jgi:hypothetical protein
VTWALCVFLSPMKMTSHGYRINVPVHDLIECELIVVSESTWSYTS